MHTVPPDPPPVILAPHTGGACPRDWASLISSLTSCTSLEDEKGGAFIQGIAEGFLLARKPIEGKAMGHGSPRHPLNI